MMEKLIPTNQYLLSLQVNSCTFILYHGKIETHQLISALATESKTIIGADPPLMY